MTNKFSIIEVKGNSIIPVVMSIIKPHYYLFTLSGESKKFNECICRTIIKITLAGVTFCARKRADHENTLTCF